MTESATRRQRLRAQTETEIKDLAWAAMEAAGRSELSLRDIARQMGMAPSALYRYFANRDDLQNAMVVDAFESIGEVVTDAYDRARHDGLDALDAFAAIADAYRSWAHAHRAHYALLYATKLPDYRGTPETALAAMRSFGVLQQLTADAVAEGALDLTRVEALTDDELRTTMQSWAEMSDQHVPAESLVASLWCYTAMHGAIALELNGHLPPPLVENRAFYDSMIRAMLDQIRADRS